MAIVQALGKPTYFITFTANPYWPEVDELLKAGQSRIDRADATLRVFRIKLQSLLDDLREGKILGAKSVYIFHVVEFQKRGLAHGHSEYEPVGAHADAAYALCCHGHLSSPA
jgi:hypothetical protein